MPSSLTIRASPSAVPGSLLHPPRFGRPRLAMPQPVLEMFYYANLQNWNLDDQRHLDRDRHNLCRRLLGRVATEWE